MDKSLASSFGLVLTNPFKGLDGDFKGIQFKTRQLTTLKRAFAWTRKKRYLKHSWFPLLKVENGLGYGARNGGVFFANQRKA